MDVERLERIGAVRHVRESWCQPLREGERSEYAEGPENPNETARRAADQRWKDDHGCGIGKRKVPKHSGYAPVVPLAKRAPDEADPSEVGP